MPPNLGNEHQCTGLMLLVPFMLTVQFLGLVSGPTRLGGGEKDILPTTPLLLWSLISCMFFHVLSIRRRAIAAVVRGCARGELRERCSFGLMHSSN